ncbi:GTPase ObgE [Natranaerobius thermophilus]|uniref:GTPase Obg n=1 Tax=Natranaerobius thermophilus (strain ATCC BAA-1301 / DSM 18059 / JW/NM-WN-LF) TaxID=457570 RepID=OBG_NATTJ|nr:GTPase ObgE [Natranaerobius thermophilus]B2A6B7.1 RecName: Full=GTPase Obg; AltName: Full=GTP-binding protein Obg [Natranaerobius thermophilus JW/NM-WN-LF]ACB84128.1 GTP-binding protein Obg/CgtA [Natranaerobius thermophilus JW/NM-WN-LF]
MFIDRAKIYVKGGDGGNGIVAFRREKYVPDGGPSGGDGGKGGNVILEVDPGLKSLMDYKYNIHIKGKRGEHGQGSNQHGKSGQDKVIKVPPGTVVKEATSGKVLADLVHEHDSYIAAEGGRGGRGNTRFANPKNKAPRFSEDGKPGEEKWIVLELKVMAEVGLIGYPNVGKSTLLSQVTKASPKIDSYHFTTLNPNLGVVELEEGSRFVMADIPGLIEGAHQGRGLGDQFLRHIERTKMLIHVIDIASIEGRDPVLDIETINEELKGYNSRVMDKPQVIAANKMDLGDQAEENLQRLLDKVNSDEILIPEQYKKIFPISAATGEGLRELLDFVAEKVAQLPDTHDTFDIDLELPESEENTDTEQEALFTMSQDDKIEEKPKSDFGIRKEGDIFIVKHEKLEKILNEIDVHTEKGRHYFQAKVDEFGLEEALVDKGIKPGDTVKIGNVEFEYQ